MCSFPTFVVSEIILNCVGHFCHYSCPCGAEWFCSYPTLEEHLKNHKALWRLWLRSDAWLAFWLKSHIRSKLKGFPTKQILYFGLKTQEFGFTILSQGTSTLGATWALALWISTGTSSNTGWVEVPGDNILDELFHYNPKYEIWAMEKIMKEFL